MATLSQKRSQELSWLLSSASLDLSFGGVACPGDLGRVGYIYPYAGPEEGTDTPGSQQFSIWGVLEEPDSQAMAESRSNSPKSMSWPLTLCLLHGPGGTSASYFPRTDSLIGSIRRFSIPLPLSVS